jgi:hypothetical protein
LCSGLEFLTVNSALFTLHESNRKSGTIDDHNRFYQSLEPISKRISEFSRLLFADVEQIEFETLSPYVPYSLYQAAVVQKHLWKQNNDASNKEAVDSLKTILEHFSARWSVAGMAFHSTLPCLVWWLTTYSGAYLNALSTTSPPIMLPPHGFFISIGKTQIHTETGHSEFA